jgi:hypothetical protein
VLACWVAGREFRQTVHTWQYHTARPPDFVPSHLPSEYFPSMLVTLGCTNRQSKARLLVPDQLGVVCLVETNLARYLPSLISNVRIPDGKIAKHDRRCHSTVPVHHRSYPVLSSVSLFVYASWTLSNHDAKAHTLQGWFLPASTASAILTSFLGLRRTISTRPPTPLSCRARRQTAC